MTKLKYVTSDVTLCNVSKKKKHHVSEKKVTSMEDPDY